ncbi:MAG TPA: hypothetical protein VMV46_20290 [Thermoanaerobaculia bacterium]|nr:hypothetical protein [Thermoanaerobaculia bacterium]
MSEASEGATPRSWILELRGRLGGESGELPVRDGIALFLGLFVDQGRLWIALVEHPPLAGDTLSRISLPACELEAGLDPWVAAATAARELLGIEPGAVLRVGRLEPHWPDPALGIDRPLYPCVAAIPAPTPPPGSEMSVRRLPLIALATPELAERRAERLGGRTVEVNVVHVGGHTLWGPTVEVIDDLLARAGLGH